MAQKLLSNLYRWYLGCKQKLREAVNDLIGLGAAKELVLSGTEQL
jgi:hypothetical protein